MKQTENKYLFSNRDLFTLILPLILEQFLAIFVGMADSVMVASVGETAVSAVSLVDSVMILMINLFTGLTAGGGIIAGQALGRKHKEDGCEAVEQTLVFSVLFSMAITFLVYAGKSFILHVVFGQIEAEVMRDCNLYLLIVTASIPFLAAYNAGAAMYRSMGDSRTPMLMSLLMNGMNLVGNAILLYGLHMGVEGAAIPTLLSRAIAGIWMVCLMKDRSKPLHIRSITGLRLKPSVLQKILHIGIPSSFENSVFQLGKLLVLSLISSFGTVSIAANAVSSSICGFEVLVASSIGIALSAVAAQCVGAGDYTQVRYYTRKLMKYAYAGMLFSSILIVLLLPVLVRLYHLSPETGALAKQIILYHSVMGVLAWASSFAFPNVLRASNDVGFCMWVSILSMWFCRIGLSFILAKYLGMGVLGVWVAMTIDWIVRSLLFLFRYRGHKWEMKSA